MEAVNLHQLQLYIRQVIVLNFEHEYWVKCEISQSSKRYGNYYLELIDKEGDEIVAISRAVLWNSDLKFIIQEHGSMAEDVLKAHQKVLLKVKVHHHVKYGLQLVIHDLDLNFTVGSLAVEKQKTIERLTATGAIDKNKLIPLPPVVQRIAILSNPQAAGYVDFITQLRENTYGFSFKTTLFDIPVQGDSVLANVTKRMKEIIIRDTNFDAVVIIRGGGSKLDLSCFDAYELCQTLSKSTLPIITGIGHEIDESVTDMISNTSCKTPTAVAEFIINRNLQFWQYLNELENQVQEIVLQKTDVLKNELALLKNQLALNLQESLSFQKTLLKEHQNSVVQTTQQKIQEQKLNLLHQEQLVNALHPQKVLNRGFAIIETSDAKRLASNKSISKQKSIVIHQQDGKQEYEITPKS